jgi:hypothetical protein
MNKAKLGLLVTALLLSQVPLAACRHAQPIHVLEGPPSVAFRTLGMVSGQGENEASAMSATVAEADRLDADAIIVVSRRPVGRVIIVTARAIRYQAPPPEQAPPPY